MNYTDRMAHLLAQRAYSRAVARGGVRALLRPYTLGRVPVVPAQRRRVVETERISA